MKKLVISILTALGTTSRLLGELFSEYFSSLKTNTYRTLQQTAIILAVPVLIGVWTKIIPLGIGDAILVPLSFLIAWKSAKPTKSWIVVQLFIGLFVGYTALDATLKFQILFSLWTYSVMSIVEGIRVWMLLRRYSSRFGEPPAGWSGEWPDVDPEG